MDRTTFRLIQYAIYYAELLLKSDSGLWINKRTKRIQAFVAVKGNYLRPELPEAFSLAGQVVFSCYHGNQIQGEFPINEGSPDFKKIIPRGTGIFIKLPTKPSSVKSHRPRKEVDFETVFTVGASGGSNAENIMLIRLFRKAMKVFLSKFKEVSRNERYSIGKVKRFYEKNISRLCKFKKIKKPDMESMESGKVEILYVD